ncbi:MAG: hypothetical protein MUE69_24865 [Myxococcota bacterium]|nr:hypothetical protein [Myxococcota bacterium]
MRCFAVSLTAALTLVACSAPPAERACQDLCDQRIFACGSPQSESECMWICLAGMEWRKQEGRRCHKQHRREIACLANVDDCEFLLDEIRYRRGDPCAERGNARAAACNENGVPGDELVPLSFDPDAEWPWSEEGDEDPESEDDSDDADADADAGADDADADDDDGVIRGDIYRL